MTWTLREAVQRHVDLFNAAVRSGDYSDFLATFADDAVMRFVGVPAGPFRGIGEIAAAYAAQPPSGTITIRSIEEVSPDTARVAVDYDTGGSGSMTVRWRDGQVVDLEVSFD
jgi:uncharacterized protein (TIGR02246 family)